MHNRGLLIVISGPSGAGKGTICKALLEKRDDLFISVSATTRSPRAGEVDGVNYHFLTKDLKIDEERIAVEVAIFADKAAVDEEVTRLKSHINQVRETLKLNEPIGRKLDFIVQEMNRETNTIGSKSSDIQMTNIVIDIKNILEKIREQVQNIE